MCRPMPSPLLHQHQKLPEASEHFFSLPFYSALYGFCLYQVFFVLLVFLFLILNLWIFLKPWIFLKCVFSKFLWTFSHPRTFYQIWDFFSFFVNIFKSVIFKKNPLNFYLCFYLNRQSFFKILIFFKCLNIFQTENSFKITDFLDLQFLLSNSWLFLNSWTY